MSGYICSWDYRTAHCCLDNDTQRPPNKDSINACICVYIERDPSHWTHAALWVVTQWRRVRVPINTPSFHQSFVHSYGIWQTAAHKRQQDRLTAHSWYCWLEGRLRGGGAIVNWQNTVLLQRSFSLSFCFLMNSIRMYVFVCLFVVCLCLLYMVKLTLCLS